MRLLGEREWGRTAQWPLAIDKAEAFISINANGLVCRACTMRANNILHANAARVILRWLHITLEQSTICTHRRRPTRLAARFCVLLLLMDCVPMCHWSVRREYVDGSTFDAYMKVECHHQMDSSIYYFIQSRSRRILVRGDSFRVIKSPFHFIRMHTIWTRMCLRRMQSVDHG